MVRGRAPVQADSVAALGLSHPARLVWEEREGRSARAAGMIDWDEHAKAWEGYAARFGGDQSAERIAERGGFSYGELLLFLGRDPVTWKPRREKRSGR